MRGMVLLSVACLLGATAIVLLSRGAAAAGTVVPGGDITTNTTWTLAGSPYRIQGFVTVNIPNGSLRIEPGVQVLFDGSYGLYISSGAVYANGTAAAAIDFRPTTDTGQPTQWNTLDVTSAKHIRVTASSGVSVIGPLHSHALIENATFDRGEYGLFVRALPTSAQPVPHAVTVSRCVFENITSTALYVEGSNGTYANLTIDHADRGIDLVANWDDMGNLHSLAQNNLLDHVTVTNVSTGVLMLSKFGGLAFTTGNLLVNSSFRNIGVSFPEPFWGKAYANDFANTTQDFGFNYSQFGRGQFDSGARGNYWSSYTGTDANGDGIGDTPYGPDRYPLMSPVAGAGVLPAGATMPTGSTGPAPHGPLTGPVLVLVVIAGAAVATAAAWVVAHRAKRNPPQ